MGGTVEPVDPASPAADRTIPLDSTAALLSRTRSGDTASRDRLIARYLPLLERWARGRLPAHARGLLDTSDLVQMTLIRSLNKMDGFDSRHEGAFLGYLRRILLNLIRDEIRRVGRRPAHEELGEEIADSSPSPLEEAIGSDVLEQYEAALGRLGPEQQEALLMSIEFGCSPEEIALATGRPSADAARMYVARAMIRLAEEMGGHERERTG
jgi:RNA polymerase sigma-70 factor (ECF subfamily)